MSQLVIDSNNHHPINGAQLKLSGAVALIAKATEGTVYRDPTYASQRIAASQAGVPFGGYVYIHWNDPGEQFKFFLEYAAPRKDELQPVVDAEDPKASMEQLARRAYACLTALEGEGYAPLLYCSSSVWTRLVAIEPRLKRFRVWEAQYPGRFARWFPRLAVLRAKLGRGATVVMWQWTDAYAVGKATFDASRLFVSVDKLRITPPVKGGGAGGSSSRAT